MAEHLAILLVFSHGGGLMARRLSVISVVAILCFAGCSQSGKVQTKLDCGSDPLDTCTIVIERLHSEKLPALESVERWKNQYGPGLKLATAHYEVFTTLLEPLMLRQIPGFLESAYRGYNKQLPNQLETRTKFTVYLFVDRQQWESFTDSFAGEQAPVFRKIKAGAYYLKGACVVYDIGRKRTFAALGHEGWHQFNSRYFQCRLPSWLDEGVAMLFESSRYEDGMFYFEPAENLHRLAALRNTLSNNQQIPLHELISISPGEVLASNQDETVVAFYSQSYALVRFLIESDLAKYTNNYRRLLWDGLSGKWPLDRTNKSVATDRNLPRTILWNRTVGPQLFKYYIAGSFEQVEKEYLRFCWKIVTNVVADEQL